MCCHARGIQGFMLGKLGILITYCSSMKTNHKIMNVSGSNGLR